MLESSREVKKIVGDLRDDGLERKRAEQGMSHSFSFATAVSYLLTGNAATL